MARLMEEINVAHHNQRKAGFVAEVAIYKNMFLQHNKDLVHLG